MDVKKEFRKRVNESLVGEIKIKLRENVTKIIKKLLGKGRFGLE